MHRDTRLSVDVTREPMWCTESSDQVMESLAVSAILGIESAHGALEPQGCEDCWSSMSGPNDEDDIYVILPYQEVQVRIHKNQAGTCSPMSYSTQLAMSCVQLENKTDQEALA